MLAPSELWNERERLGKAAFRLLQIPVHGVEPLTELRWQIEEAACQ